MTALAPVDAIQSLAVRWRGDPVAFVQESYRADPEGRPVHVDGPQERILRAVVDSDRVAVRSSHGIGKTTTAAWLTHWWLSTRYPALVVTLAGTWNHLEDKLWPEIHTWGRQWKMADAFEWQSMEIRHKGEGSAWRAKASSSDRPEAIEGWHSPNLLVIIDEAKFMPDELYAAIRGALTQTSAGGGRPKVVVLSTPPLSKVGWYADLFGTKSQGWELIHVSGHDSSRVSEDWIEGMRQDFGEDSPVYQSKVLGNIPEANADSVVQLRWIEAAQRSRGNEMDRRPAVVTCDVARQGEDLTVLGLFNEAKFSIVKWEAKNDLMQVVAWCTTAVKDAQAGVLVLDDTGLGGGVTDRLRELQREGKFPAACRIIPERFGESADRKDRFHNEKDELWWHAREALRDGGLSLPTDHELNALALPRGSSLKAQLAAPIYEEDSQSRIHVLDKRVDNREKTRSLPTKSPDLAHAFILGVKHWNKLKQVAPEETMDTREIFAARLAQARKREKPKYRNPYAS